MLDVKILDLLHFKALGQRPRELKPGHKDTFAWIFDNPDLVSALEPDLQTTVPIWLQRGSGIFHIAGKPGSGKSTMMKYLCSHPELRPLLVEWAGDRELIFAKFFFWKLGGSSEEKTIVGLIRSLLYEVLCESPSLTKTLFPETRTKMAQHPERRDGPELITSEIRDAMERLVELSAMPSLPPSTKHVRCCFFVDGLDEFVDAGERYEDLVAMLLHWTKKSNGNIKICVSSRIQEPFTGRFQVGQRITLNRLTKGDIDRFVRDRLQSNRNFEKLVPHQREELVQGVLVAADGVFLSVSLILISLLDGLDMHIPIKRLQEQVAKTPETLEALLTQIIEDIGKEYRDGADLLLATILRCHGIFISPEAALFDDYIFMENPDFYLTIFGCFVVLAAADARKKINHNLHVRDLDFSSRFHEDMSVGEIRELMKTAVLSRCNGLIEMGDNSTIKFMHRSIPEVLQAHFQRCPAPSRRLSDHQTSLTMAWAYGMETQLKAAMVLQRGSLLDFLLGRIARGRNVSGIPLKSESPPAEDMYTGMARLAEFLFRLRQIRLDDAGEEIFHVLLSIDSVIHEAWGPGSAGFSGDPWFTSFTSGDDLEDYEWSLIDTGALVGHYEFIDWVFKGKRVPDVNNRLFGVVSSASFWITGDHGHVAMNLEVMKVVFRLGLSADVTFPVGSKAQGIPLWHAVLVRSFLFLGRLHIGDSIEFWLRNGADPHVHFDWEVTDTEVWISGTISPEDGSSMLRVSDICPSDRVIVEARGQFESREEDDPPSLRTLARRDFAENHQVILDLIDGKGGHGSQDS